MRDDVGIDELPDVLINVLTGEVVGIGIDALVGVEIIVVAPSAGIDLEFAVSVSYIVDVLSDVVVDILVDLLADVNVKVLATLMTALTFVAAPSEEVMYFF